MLKYLAFGSALFLVLDNVQGLYLNDRSKKYIVCIAIAVVVLMDNVSIKNHFLEMIGMNSGEDSTLESVEELETSEMETPEIETQELSEPEVPELDMPEEVPEEVPGMVEPIEKKKSCCSNAREVGEEAMPNYFLLQEHKFNQEGVPNDKIKDLIFLSKANDIYNQRAHIPETRSHPHIGKERPPLQPEQVYYFH
jgi:hypothetical protein